uniref:DNA invertase n=1 Tax=Escherichia coli TaxID=562 RepID=UPI00235624D4|nr:DNA invertase [Escherichia coli]
MPDLGTFQKKMLHHCISATPLVVWREWNFNGQRRAVPFLNQGNQGNTGLTKNGAFRLSMQLTLHDQHL